MAQDTHLTQTGAEVQALLDKVEGIEAGAQVNDIEKIKVNGAEQTITDKAVDLLIKKFAGVDIAGSGDLIQGDFLCLGDQMLCAPVNTTFVAIVFNRGGRFEGIWEANDYGGLSFVSDRCIQIGEGTCKCYKTAQYHAFDPDNAGYHRVLVVSSHPNTPINFTVATISAADRVEQETYVVANQDYVDTAVAAKYTKPASGIPASDLASGVIPDVSNFITASVDNLVNYYLKDDTYTKAEVAALIGAIQQFHYEIYASTAAVTNPQGNVLYLIGPTGSGEDKYEEYVYDSTKATPWVKIGDTSIDLSNYVTTSDLNTALAAYTTSEELSDLLDAKQDVINDLDDIRDGAAAGATAYQKPQTGIPASDLAAGVIPDISGKADKVIPSSAGNIAMLDSTGNPADSGVSVDDVQTEPEIFWVEYGITAYYDILAAYNDGKLCLLRYEDDNNDRLFVLGCPRDGDIVFYSLSVNGYIYYIQCQDDDSWHSSLMGVYEKPFGGIPKTDLADAVQTSLGKADTALQSFTETDPTVPSWAKQPNKPSYSYSEISNTPTIPDVTGKADKVSNATNGNFAALDANGNLTDSGHKHSDYLTTHQDISGKADKVSNATNGHLAALDGNGNLADSGKSASDFQPTIDSTHKLPYSLISDTPTIPTVEALTTSEIDTIWSNAS